MKEKMKWLASVALLMVSALGWFAARWSIDGLTLVAWAVVAVRIASVVVGFTALVRACQAWSAMAAAEKADKIQDASAQLDRLEADRIRAAASEANQRKHSPSVPVIEHEQDKAVRDIKFECPKCKQPLEAPEDMRGKQINCPACEQAMVIPRIGERCAPPRMGIDMNAESDKLLASVTAGKRMKLALAIEYLAVIVAAIALLIDERGVASFSTALALASEVAVMVFGSKDKRPAGGDFFVYAFFLGWIALVVVAWFVWSRSGCMWALLLPVMGLMYNPTEHRKDGDNETTSANGWWIYAGFALLGAWFASTVPAWSIVMPIFAFAFIFARRGYIAVENNEKLLEAAQRRDGK